MATPTTTSELSFSEEMRHTPGMAVHVLRLLAAATTIPRHLAAIAADLAEQIQALRRQSVDWRVPGDAVPMLDSQWLLAYVLAEHRDNLERTLRGKLRGVLGMLRTLEDDDRSWASLPPLHRRITPSSRIMDTLPALERGLINCMAAAAAPTPPLFSEESGASSTSSGDTLEQTDIDRLAEALATFLPMYLAPTPPPAPTDLDWTHPDSSASPTPTEGSRVAIREDPAPITPAPAPATIASRTTSTGKPSRRRRTRQERRQRHQQRLQDLEYMRQAGYFGINVPKPPHQRAAGTRVADHLHNNYRHCWFPV